MLETIAQAKQQRSSDLNLFWVQRTLKEWAQECRVRGKDLLEQMLSLLGQPDLGPATIGLHVITLNQPFRFQTVQYAGKRPFRHQRCGREFRTGPAIGVSQGRQDVELRRREMHGSNMPVIHPGKGEIGFHQWPKNFEIGVLVKVRNVHAMI